MSFNFFGSEFLKSKNWFSGQPRVPVVKPQQALRDMTDTPVVEGMEKKRSEQEASALSQLEQLAKSVDVLTFVEDASKFTLEELADTLETVLLFYPPGSARYQSNGEYFPKLVAAYSGIRTQIREINNPNLNPDDSDIVDKLRLYAKRTPKFVAPVEKPTRT